MLQESNGYHDSRTKESYVTMTYVTFKKLCGHVLLSAVVPSPKVEPCRSNRKDITELHDYCLSIV